MHLCTIIYTRMLQLSQYYLEVIIMSFGALRLNADGSTTPVTSAEILYRRYLKRWRKNFSSIDFFKNFPKGRK